jgi:hypothetical protein
MKESHGEGLASHTDPESCAASRKAGREALTPAVPFAPSGHPSAKRLAICLRPFATGLRPRGE